MAKTAKGSKGAKRSAIKARSTRSTRTVRSAKPSKSKIIAKISKSPKPQKSQALKRVFFFGAGKAEATGAALSKSVLGGKGLGLMEMTTIGLPVPGGFTISIQTCDDYYKAGK